MAIPEEDVLAQETRRTVFDYVRHVPGAHLRRVARELRLPIGQVIYHLDYLERREMVVVKRDAGFKRYFVRNLYSRGEKRVLAACRHAVPRRVLVALLDAREHALTHGGLADAPRGLSHGAILERVDVSGSTLSFHLARMVDAGVLHREKVGRAQVYHLLEPGTVTGVLDRFGSTFHDPAVDAFRARTRPVTVDGPERPRADATPARV